MKFSIVTPVLNGQTYIKAAIDSVVAQTYDNWELIIMDGGSTDDTVEIARAYASADPRIHCYAEADAGIYDAILNGFSRSDGGWLSWLNSDDLYAPWCLATTKDYIEYYDCEWLIGYSGCWDDKGRLRYARPAGLYPRKLIAAGWFHDNLLGFLQQESIFFSRALFDRLTAAELDEIRTMKLAGDFLLWRRFAQHTKLHTVPSVLGGFRQHGDNISSMEAANYRDEIRETGIVEPPRIMANVFAPVFRFFSAWSMMRAAARAGSRLSDEIAGRQDTARN